MDKASQERLGCCMNKKHGFDGTEDTVQQAICQRYHNCIDIQYNRTTLNVILVFLYL